MMNLNITQDNLYLDENKIELKDIDGNIIDSRDTQLK